MNLINLDFGKAFDFILPGKLLVTLKKMRINISTIQCQRNLVLGVKTADGADSKIMGLEELVLPNNFIS